jgi:hypothetical protein
VVLTRYSNLHTSESPVANPKTGPDYSISVLEDDNFVDYEAYIRLKLVCLICGQIIQLPDKGAWVLAGA